MPALAPSADLLAGFEFAAAEEQRWTVDGGALAKVGFVGVHRALIGLERSRAHDEAAAEVG